MYVALKATVECVDGSLSECFVPKVTLKPGCGISLSLFNMLTEITSSKIKISECEGYN